ncbi:C2H2 type zinc-finger-domain-containing protein [Xylariaceae sp. FL0255]|nr:C2H2 type zinc-finger-domain-containing protein [Xylariaceae sp. FL0255]
MLEGTSTTTIITTLPMLGAATVTSTNTITSLPMSPSSSLETGSASQPLHMQCFTPEQCLFCPKTSPSFADSVTHMQSSHGLFVPHRRQLVVDEETLFKYLHLVIFGYRECIHCGTERTTVQAVQQHMTGKGHCTYDVSEDSEFAEFYDFSQSIEDEHLGSDSQPGVDHGDRQRETSYQKPILADEDSIRLPSGRIILKNLAAETSSTRLRHQIRRTLPSRLEYSTAAAESAEDKASKEGTESDTSDMRVISKGEKQKKAKITCQLANRSTSDRSSLKHLSTNEQRSILATQHRHAEKVQKEERRRQGKIDRKGNKNLYAYWHTETPVYQCG